MRETFQEIVNAFDSLSHQSDFSERNTGLAPQPRVKAVFGHGPGRPALVTRLDKQNGFSVTIASFTVAGSSHGP